MTKPSFDTTLRPQDDFFGYVNNHWLKANPIPPSESTWGTFYVLRDAAVTAVHNILEELAEADESTLTHDNVLLKKVYTSALSFNDHGSIHSATLRAELDKVHDIGSWDELASYLGYAHRSGYSPFWTTYVGLDDKDSSVQVLRLYQAGLSLPNRDYYLDTSKNMVNIRTKYESFYTKTTALLSDLTQPAWSQVAQLEHALAEISWTDVELRDVQKNYTKLPLTELRQRLDKFNWDAYFSALGWAAPTDHFVIDQFGYIEKCLEVMCSNSLADIKAYLEWHVTNAMLAWFSQATSTLNFDFYGRAIHGIKEQKPLWKRASLLMDGLVVGELVGREYAARHFPESSKQTVLALVEDIRSAYHVRIDRLTWMSVTTKQRAHTKLDNLKVFIGYPSVWKDFSALECSDNLLDNLLRLYCFETDLDLAKVGKPPANEDWEMNAHTVNAYHHPNRLEIVFPAAILQSPFFDPQASDATNLGGIGAVIGHELTHGFDDQGSEFDEHGNSNPWQKKEERIRFNKLANNIVRQANAFETVPGVFLQGKLILGEAIADIGGLELALSALRAKASSKNDFQDLFVNFARCECGQATAERALELAKTDPHPPSPFRVNCVVCHTDVFYDIYDVTEKDKLYLPPENRAKIW